MLLEPKKIIPLLHIEYGMNVLDVGSGVGFWAKPISELVGPRGNVFAVDNHPEMIDRMHHDGLETIAANISPIHADLFHMHTWHLKTHSCDRVLFIRMVSTVEDSIAETLRQLLEYMNDRGEMVIVDGIHYRKMIIDVLHEMQITANYDIDEIKEMFEKTDHHFFGIRISRRNS
jgi:protein-L-isoaspartate O-methyltransferase